MKFRLLSSLLLLAFFVSGCGQKDTSTPAGATAENTGPAAPSGPRTIEITAGDNMKFNVARIEARPGEELKIVLTNIGSQPKEVMGHNWVLLNLGTDVAAFDAAAMTAKDSDYIPPSMKNAIIAHTKLLGPRKSDEVTFKAPEAPGEYTFICSFPAHYQVGMKGVLVVR